MKYIPKNVNSHVMCVVPLLGCCKGNHFAFRAIKVNCINLNGMFTTQLWS